MVSFGLISDIWWYVLFNIAFWHSLISKYYLKGENRYAIWVWAIKVTVVIIPKGSESPEAKSRDSNIPRVLFLLVNDTRILLVPEAKPRDTNIPRVLLPSANDTWVLLVPKAKPRDTNSIYYYYFYSANIPYHLLMSISQCCMRFLPVLVISIMLCNPVSCILVIIWLGNIIILLFRLVYSTPNV